MILTDGVNTFKTNNAQEIAEPLWNSNKTITIGGVVKQQADSERLRIKIDMRLTLSELRALANIINNFSQQLFYTPSRPLYNRTSAVTIAVVAEPLQINILGYNGAIVYHCTLVLEEVLG